MNCEFCNKYITDIWGAFICHNCDAFFENKESYYRKNIIYIAKVINFSYAERNIKIICYSKQRSDVSIIDGNFNSGWFWSKNKVFNLEDNVFTNMSNIEIHNYLTKFSNNMEFA